MDQIFRNKQMCQILIRCKILFLSNNHSLNFISKGYEGRLMSAAIYSFQ